MAAKIVPGTGIVAVCDVSLSRSSLRCYHQAPCLHRTSHYDRTFQDYACRLVENFVVLLMPFYCDDILTASYLLGDAGH